MKLSDTDIVLLAYHDAGWRGRDLEIGVAIEMGEGDGDPNVYSRVDKPTAKWGVSKGLWQIRPLHEDKGTGRIRDENLLHVPAFNAHSAGVIRRQRGDFSDWGAYNNGSYKRHLLRARAAINEVMAWRLVDSLKTLLAEANRLAPNRSKASDGTIGDAAHRNRTSDHNPESDGTVDAVDITHDPANGWDCDVRVAQIIQRRDKRVRYIIWNKHIWSGSDGPSPWVKRWYGDWSTGKNPHDKHMHVSVLDRHQDDTSAWFPANADNVGDVTADEVREIVAEAEARITARLEQLHKAAYQTVTVDGVKRVVPHIELVHQDVKKVVTNTTPQEPTP